MTLHHIALVIVAFEAIVALSAIYRVFRAWGILGWRKRFVAYSYEPALLAAYWWYLVHWPVEPSETLASYAYGTVLLSSLLVAGLPWLIELAFGSVRHIRDPDTRSACLKKRLILGSVFAFTGQTYVTLLMLGLLRQYVTAVHAGIPLDSAPIF